MNFVLLEFFKSNLSLPDEKKEILQIKVSAKGLFILKIVRNVRSWNKSIDQWVQVKNWNKRQSAIKRCE